VTLGQSIVAEIPLAYRRPVVAPVPTAQTTEWAGEEGLPTPEPTHSVVSDATLPLPLPPLTNPCPPPKRWWWVGPPPCGWFCAVNFPGPVCVPPGPGGGPGPQPGGGGSAQVAPYAPLAWGAPPGGATIQDMGIKALTFTDTDLGIPSMTPQEAQDAAQINRGLPVFSSDEGATGGSWWLLALLAALLLQGG